MSSRRFDLVICGGGAVGLSIAYLCAQDNMRVAILDRGQAGKESSWAGAGILPPPAILNALDPIDQLRSLSHQLHLSWASELKSMTQVDNELRCCGAIYVAQSIGEYATLMANETWWQEHGIRYERLDRQQLQQLEPNLATSRVYGEVGWWLPDECQLRNPRHVQALRRACELMHVEFFEDEALTSIQVNAERITSILSASHEFSADYFCFATGAWSKSVLEQLGVRLEVYPVRGQIVLYQCQRPVIQRIINEGNRYAVPRLDGHLLVGSSEEEVGFVKETTETVIRDLASWAESWLPLLKDESIERTWAGFRPATIDGLPYIGQVPGIGNSFVATGHYRHGLHLSPATAKLIFEMIRGLPPSIPTEAFRLIRGRSSPSN